MRAERGEAAMKFVIGLAVTVGTAIGVASFLFLTRHEPSPDSAGVESRRVSASRLEESGSEGEVPPRGGFEHGASSQVIAVPAGASVERDAAPQKNSAPRVPFTSGEQALNALRNGAIRGDPLTLQRFANLPRDTPWAEEFYRDVSAQLDDKKADPDDRQYAANVLAISGRAENIQALFDRVANAGSPEDISMLTSALAMANGGDEIVPLAVKELGSGNPNVQFSALTALTNQGSRAAAEALYAHALETGGSPESEKEDGTGLSMMLPDQEAVGFLSDVLRKEDRFSALAIGPLVNGGESGINAVFDVLQSTKNDAFREELLTALSSKLAVDETVLGKLTELQNSPDARLREFATEMLQKEEGENSSTFEEAPEQ